MLKSAVITNDRALSSYHSSVVKVLSKGLDFTPAFAAGQGFSQNWLFPVLGEKLPMFSIDQTQVYIGLGD
jgi:hypothetical protein